MSNDPASLEARIERLTAVRLAPGDVILATVPEAEPQEYELIRALLEDVFPGHRVVILSGGIVVEVIRPEEDDA